MLLGATYFPASSIASTAYRMIQLQLIPRIELLRHRHYWQQINLFKNVFQIVVIKAHSLQLLEYEGRCLSLVELSQIICIEGAKVLG